jgi:hypothetical protein
MTESTRLESGPPHDVDRLLRDFFRAEMPHPWPAADVPAMRVAPPRTLPWYRSPFRLALAASVLLAATGLVTLNHVFPTDAPAGPGLNTGANNIASGPRDRPTALPVLPGRQVERHRTPAGHDAELREFNLPDGRTIIEVIELPSTPNPR